jgi:hypothetical protein
MSYKSATKIGLCTVREAPPSNRPRDQGSPYNLRPRHRCTGTRNWICHEPRRANRLFDDFAHNLCYPVPFLVRIERAYDGQERTSGWNGNVYGIGQSSVE